MCILPSYHVVCVCVCSSKHDGLAGTRFGWALVKDKDLAQRMRSIVRNIALSLSADIELRILNSMKTIVGESFYHVLEQEIFNFFLSDMDVDDDGLLPFHKYGHNAIFDRFQLLRDVLDSISGLELLNSASSPGAYAWIHCYWPLTCQEEFARVNLTGISGSSFGGSDQGKFELPLLTFSQRQISFSSSQKSDFP